MKLTIITSLIFCITLSAQELPDLPDLSNLLNLPDLPDLPDLSNRSIQRGEIVKETYHFDVEGIDRMDVSISYGLGELIIADNPNSNAIDGTIEYYPNRMTPIVDYRTIGTKGKLKIKVESNREWEDDNEYSFHWGDWKGFKNEEFDSEVNFQLPQNIPMDMEMDFGLGEANIDLSNLSFSDFSLECGLSDVKVIMETPNSVQCKRLVIETGLGDFNGEGLGNLRAKELKVDIGLGSADIDLTTDITSDMEGDIEVGLGSLDLILPKNANIKLDIDHSFLSSVDVNDLVKKNGLWVSPKWDDSLPTIELEISVGLGSVDVKVE